MSDNRQSGVHWSFWAVGFGALIWNAMGCLNYVMQMHPDSLARYPDAARALVESRPAWSTGAFAIAVFGGVLGCLLLLYRSSTAYYAFVVSLLAVIGTNIHTFKAGGSPQIWAGSLMSLVVAAFLIWYAKRAAGKGWTR